MLVVCVGTATDIGKSWVGAQVLSAARAAGISVAARKPAQSFDPGETGPTDAMVLARATGQAVDDVCPPHRSYPVAMAPPMAAEALSLPVPVLRDLVEETVWASPRAELRWVESVGGVRSPVAADADSVDLCDALKPDLVVLVADAGLGTINSVRLSAAALSGHDVAVYLNRFRPADSLHAANLRWLKDRDGYRVLSTRPELVSLVSGRVGAGPPDPQPRRAAGSRRSG